MKSDHARQIIQSRKRFYFLLATVCIESSALLLFLFSGIFFNFWFGPFEKDVDDLRSLSRSNMNALQLYEAWVTIDVETNYPITIIHQAFNADGVAYRESHAMVVQMGDYLLIVESDDVPDSNSLRLTGSIWYENNYSDRYAEIREEFQQRYPDVQAEFLPLTLNTSTYAELIAQIGIVIVVLFLAIGCFSLRRAIRLAKNLNIATVIKIASHGESGDSNEVLKEIEYELRRKRIRSLGHKYYCITHNWFIFAPPNRFFAIRYEDIIWVRELGSFIILYDRYGRSSSLNFLEPWVYRALHDKAPWAAWDNSKEMQRYWKQNREEFINNVDVMRRGFVQSEKDKPKQLPTD